LLVIACHPGHLSGFGGLVMIVREENGGKRLEQ